MAQPAQRLTMGQLLLGFAYASDLAFGLQLEDTVRSCYLAIRLAEQLHLSEEECRTAYYAALLKDAGCTSWTTELATAWQTDEISARLDLSVFTNERDRKAFVGWMRRHVAPERGVVTKLTRYVNVLTTSRSFFGEGYRTTVVIASRIADRIGMTGSVQDALRSLFEQWNGTGAPQGLSGLEIPIESRVVLPTFFFVPIHRVNGRDAAIEAIRAFRGRAFDPAVVDALELVVADPEFWPSFESEDIRDIVLDMEPAADSRVSEEQVDDVALAFADFIDLKSRHAAAHSRRVGAVSEQIARVMNCSDAVVTQVRRAGLMHDLGLVAVPSYTLDRPWRELSESERDAYRLHPYHGERILKRVPIFESLAEIVGTHQERADGSGYYRGLASANISLGARIIGVADRLDELTHGEPGTPALSIEGAVQALSKEPVDQEVVTALRRTLGEKTASSTPPVVRPASLTEREVEVLALMSQGLTRREIGRRLSITENTVRNHLDHIYDKTGTSNRVSATMFAMENGILIS